MKVILTSAMILTIVSVFTVGCTDNPVREETPRLPANPPTQIVSPILGDWHLQSIIGFANGVENFQWDYNSVSITLSLMPEGIFDATHRYPIEAVTDVRLRDWLELRQFEEITVTFEGKYRIAINKLWLNKLSARVQPKEVPEFDSDFDNPIFWYHGAKPEEGGMNFSLTEDGNQLELSRGEAGYIVKFIHRRLKTD